MGFIILDVIFFITALINGPKAFIPNNPLTTIVYLSWIFQLLMAWLVYNPKRQKEAQEEIKRRSNELFVQAYEAYDKGLHDYFAWHDFITAQMQSDDYYKPYNLHGESKAQIIQSAKEHWRREHPGVKHLF